MAVIDHRKLQQSASAPTTSSSVPVVVPEFPRAPEDPTRPLSAAEAIERLARNRTTALTQLQSGQLTGQNLERAKQIAEEGSEGGGSFRRGLANIFSFIDRPRQLVQLGLRDIFQVDQDRADTEIQASDYWKVITGDTEGLIERLGTDLVGESGDLSTANLLDDIWAPDEEAAWYERAARGTASFLGDVATDPLSYITVGLSGAGRAPAMAAVKSGVDDAGVVAAKSLYRGSRKDVLTKVDEIAPEALSPLERQFADEFTSAATKLHTTRIKGLSDELGRAVTPLESNDLWDEVVREVAGIGADESINAVGIIAKYGDDILTAVSSKDFAGRTLSSTAKARWDTFLGHAAHRRGGRRVFRDQWATGGIRLQRNFFNLKTQSQPVARGSGGWLKSKTFGPAARSLRDSKVGERFANLFEHTSKNRRMFQFGREGRAYQYYALEGAAQGARRSLDAPGNLIQLGNATRHLFNIAKDAGMDDEAATDLLRAATRSLAVGAPDSTVLASSTIPDAVKEPFKEYVGRAVSMYAEASDTLARFANIGELENYVPIVVHPDFRDAVRRLDVAGRLPSADEESLRVLGIDPEDWATFQEVLRHITPQGERSVRSLGSSQFFGNRTIGKEIFTGDDTAGTIMVRLGDDGMGVNVLGRQFQAPNELAASLERVAERLGIDVDNTLELDPLMSFARYITDVQNAAMESSLVHEARALGLLTDKSEAVAIDHFVYDFQPTAELAVDYARRLINDKELAIRSLQLQNVDFETIRVGGFDLEIPAVIKDRPAVVRAVERFRNTMREVKANKVGHERRIRTRAQQLRRDLRVSQETANLMASLESPDALIEAQVAARQAIEAVMNDVEAAVRTGLDYHSEALEAARINQSNAQRVARRVGQQARQRIDEWTSKYEAEFGLRPQQREVSFTVYGDDGALDFEATAKVLGELVTMSQQRLRRQVELAFEGAQSEFEDLVDRMAAMGLDPNLKVAEVPVHVRPLYGRLEALQGELQMQRAILESPDRQAFYLNALSSVAQAADRFAAARQQDYFDAFNRQVARLEAGEDIGVSLDDVEYVRDKLNTWLDYSGEEALYHPFLEDERLLRVLDEGGDGRSLVGRVLTSRNELNNLRGRVEDAARLTGSPAESPVRLLAMLQSQNDPQALNAFSQSADSLERLLRNVFGDDGNLILRQNTDKSWHVGWARNVDTVDAPPLDDVKQALAAGDVDDLPVDAVDIARIVTDFERVIDAKRRQAITAERGVAAAEKKFQELERTWRNVSRHLYGALNGRPGDVKRLRADVLFRRPDGTAVTTPGYKQLLEALPENKAAHLQSLVENAFVLDEDVIGVSKSWLQQNRALYDQTLYRPVEESLEKLRTTAARIYQQYADREVRDIQQRIDLANGFIENIEMMFELASRDRTPGGTRSSRYLQDFTSIKDDISRTARVLDDKTHIHKLDAESRIRAKEVRAAMREARSGALQRETREGFTPGGRFGTSALQDTDVDPLVGALFEDLLRSYRVMHTPWGLEQIAASSRSIARWWRSAATVSKPDFHIRNLVGGVANGFLAGVGPNNYNRVMKDLKKFRRLMRRVGTEDGLQTVDDVWPQLSDDMRDVYRAAWEQGIMQGGFARTDLTSKGVVPGGRRSLNVFKHDNAFFSAGGRMMERVEDLLRLAAFDAWYDPKNPASAALARDMTMLVHFDYQQLTQLEERIKIIAPFFVWTRNNVPLQMRMLLERPGAINVYNHAVRNATEDNDNEPWDFFPLDKYSSSLAIPTSFGFYEDTPYWSRFVIDPDLPVLALDEIPLFNEGVTDPVSQATAWLSWATELLGPQVSVPMRLGELSEMPDTVAPRGLNEVLATVDSFLAENSGGRLGVPGVTTTASGDALVGREVGELYNTALPFVDSYRRLIGLSPTSRNKVAAEGLAIPPWENQPALGLFEPPAQNRHLKGLLNSLGRGLLGGTFQTPTDTAATAFDASEFLSEMRRRERLGADL